VALVHVDEHIVVADKPTGLLSEPGRGEHLRDCLLLRLRHAGSMPELRIVHRLDRDTSGLIVLARSADAHRILSRQFHDRLVTKHYIALVASPITADHLTIDLPLRKDMDHPPRHMVDPVQGKPATTHLRVIERTMDRTRVELSPVTGRSHQLRIHLAAIGHPILGDGLYGEATTAPRLLLHATHLAFDHPATGERMTFTSPAEF
jgi:tRNA pseudouridine32 synthase/23S rRNA pseudouridine746 synthase